ncbi:glycosyltransferase [Mycobacteroides sp. LB1]|uniref:glycosyltransferase n=1 Tax=Mycobacteroides sp. LB1 TaxID=2750814 RepID=UPI00352C42A2
MGSNRLKELNRAYLPSPQGGEVHGGIAVFVVAYGRPDLLADCLRSCHEHLGELPVHVWDNSGPDYPGMGAVRASFPDVSWHGTGDNLGFAAAVNRLADLVAGAHLLLVNPDAIVKSPLTRTRAQMAIDPMVAAAAPQIDPTTPHLGELPWDNGHRAPNMLRALVSHAGYAPALRGRAISELYRTAPTEVDGYLTGACLLINRQVWNEIGGFDEEFFLYGEEADWQLRARAAGRRLVFIDEPGVTHSAKGTVTGDHQRAIRSDDLLRANIALTLEHSKGARTADLYLAGTSALDRVQRSARRVRKTRLRPGTGRPQIILTTNRLVYGGAERQHVLLATELDRRGYAVTIACMQRFGPLVAEIPATVRVVRQPWWCPTFEIGDGPTILVSGDTNTETGCGTLWRASGRHRRWLVAAHIPPELNTGTYSAPLAAAMSRADGFIALSRRHWDEVSAHQRVGTRFFTAPNGVVSRRDLPETVPRRRDLSGPLHFVMLSRIVEHKNPHLLVEALSGLAEYDWRLSIFGDGPDRQRLEALTPDSVRDRVHWRGWSPGPDHALADCDVLCVPSRSEAFPLVILEAMARAVPVIGSAVCSVPDMLDDGSGVVVDPIDVQSWRDALKDALSAPERLTALGCNGFKRMRDLYTIETMADSYEEAFTAVLKG